MTVNASPEYIAAEKEYIYAKTDEEKLACLEKMISVAPSHKGGENLRANLRARIAKIKKKQEEQKARKKGKVSLAVKRSGDAQISIIGFTNSGRSSLLSALTNANPKISEFEYTTLKPEIGTLEYGECKFQIIELPALRGNLEYDSENLSIARTSDLLVILVISNDEIDRILQELEKARIKMPMLILANKSDIYARATRAEFFISCKTGQGIERVKEQIFQKLNIIRIYTKEPGKKYTEIPLVLKKFSRVKDMAIKIRRDFVKRFEYALLWGSSAKFPGQKIGLEHELKDKDIVELHLKK